MFALPSRLDAHARRRFLAFPNAQAANAQERTVALEHNDAWMWKWLWPDNEDGAVNPSIFYAMDVVAVPR